MGLGHMLRFAYEFHPMNSTQRKRLGVWGLLTTLLLIGAAVLFQWSQSGGDVVPDEKVALELEPEETEGLETTDGADSSNPNVAETGNRQTIPAQHEEVREKLKPLRWRLLDRFGNALPETALTLRYQQQGREKKESFESDEEGWITLPAELRKTEVWYLGVGNPSDAHVDLAPAQEHHTPFLDGVHVRREPKAMVRVELVDAAGLVSSQPFVLYAFAPSKGGKHAWKPVATSPLSVNGLATLTCPAGFYQLALAFAGSRWLRLTTKGGSSISCWPHPGSQKAWRVSAPNWRTQDVEFLERGMDIPTGIEPLAKVGLLPLNAPPSQKQFLWNTSASGKVSIRVLGKEKRARQAFDLRKKVENLAYLKPRSTMLRIDSGVREGQLVQLKGSLGAPLQSKHKRHAWFFGALLGRGGETWLHSMVGGQTWRLGKDLPWEQGEQSLPHILVCQPDFLRAQASYPSGDWTTADAWLHTPRAMGYVGLEEWKLDKEITAFKSLSRVWKQSSDLRLRWEVDNPSRGLDKLRVSLAPNDEDTWMVPVIEPERIVDQGVLTLKSTNVVGTLAIGEWPLEKRRRLKEMGLHDFRVRCVDVIGEPVPHAWVAAFSQADISKTVQTVADEHGWVRVLSMGNSRVYLGSPAMPWQWWLDGPLIKHENQTIRLIVPRQKYSLQVQVTGAAKPESVVVEITPQWPSASSRHQPRTEELLGTLDANGSCHFVGLIPTLYSISVRDLTRKTRGMDQSVRLQPNRTNPVIYIDMVPREE